MAAVKISAAGFFLEGFFLEGIVLSWNCRTCLETRGNRKVNVLCKLAPVRNHGSVREREWFLSMLSVTCEVTAGPGPCSNHLPHLYLHTFNMQTLMTAR